MVLSIKFVSLSIGHLDILLLAACGCSFKKADVDTSRKVSEL